MVVVDVQDSFVDEMDELRHPYVSHVTRLIRQAIYRQRVVVALEYRGEGPSSPEIRRTLREYRKSIFMKKATDDGSSAVVRALGMFDINSKWVSICGVNATCCVEATVLGMVKRGINVRVIREAVCDVWKPKGRPERSYVNKFDGYEGKVVLV